MCWASVLLLLLLIGAAWVLRVLPRRHAASIAALFLHRRLLKMKKKWKKCCKK
jgi:hypothetical protein